MSRFYGTLKDLAKSKSTPATRGAAQHLVGTVESFSAGVRVTALADGPRDLFIVYQTKGSRSIEQELLGRLVVSDGEARWEPASTWISESGK